MLAEFSQRQIDYFHGLPPALRGTETVRNGALALVLHSRALRALGDLDVAGANATEAVQLLGKLRGAGDRSEPTTIALALAYSAQGRVLESRSDPEALPTNQRAVDLLRPLAIQPRASAAVRRAYVETATRVGYEEWSANRPEDAIRTEREVIRIAADLGARDLSDLDMGAYYAEAGAWMVADLQSLGRREEARRASEDCLALADRVLERRPGNRLALHAEQLLTGSLKLLAMEELDPQAALRVGRREEQISLSLLKLDPNNITSINNFALTEGSLGDTLWSAGHLHEAMLYHRKHLEAAQRATTGGATFYLTHSGAVAAMVFAQATLGEAAGAKATLAAAQPFLEKLRGSEPHGSTAVVLVDATDKIMEAFAEFERDNVLAAHRISTDAVHELEAVTPKGGDQPFYKSIDLHYAYDDEGQTEYLSGDFAAAERSEAKAAEIRKALGVDAMDDHRRLNIVLTWLAMAQARQGHTGDAATTIGPVVKFDRELAARNHGDQWVPLELASALYAQALAEPQQGAALLREAAALIDGLAPELKPLHDVRQRRERIRQAQQAPLTQTRPSTDDRSGG